MDIASIANSAMLMRYGQVQQTISLEIMKQEADQAARMTNMLMQNAREVQAMTKNSGSGFSVYA